MTICNFKCPHCKEEYEIQNYSLGFADAHEMRCDSCSATLMVEFYHPPMDKLYFKGLNAIEKALNQCKCGGSFKYSSLYRCSKCNHVVELEEIARQIKWPGKLKPGFKPGVALGEILYSTSIEAWKTNNH